MKLGHSVKVSPLKGSLDLEAEFRCVGAEVDLGLHARGLLSQLLKVRKTVFLDEEIIHAHLPQAEIVAHFAKCRYKVSTRHYGGKFYPKLPKVLSSLMSKYFSKKKTVIAISQFVADYLIASKEVKSLVQIKTVKYGFNAKAFLGNGEEKFTRRDNSDALVCGTLARLSPEKDLETLIRGIHDYRLSDNQPVALHIFGEGPEKDNLMSLVQELDLTSVVTFFGKTSKPVDALRSLDVFILTSRFEGFGMVLLEAMATHKIIIASDTPTSKEVLGMDGAASFFQVGNPKDLASQISKCRSMAAADYSPMQDVQLNKYESSAMALKIDEVYIGLLGKNEA